ncbi:alpha/beta fold hydrolase [Rhizobium leguminosarum]
MDFRNFGGHGERRTAFRVQLPAPTARRGHRSFCASELGWKQFSLVGHNWGGIIAWAVAAWHPDMIKRLVVLNAPHLDVMPKVLRKTPLQVVRSAYVGFFRLPFLPEFFLSLGDFRMLRFALTSTSRRGTFGSDAIERYASEWKRPGRLSAMLNYYRALTREKRVALGPDCTAGSHSMGPQGPRAEFPAGE